MIEVRAKLVFKIQQRNKIAHTTKLITQISTQWKKESKQKHKTVQNIKDIFHK